MATIDFPAEIRALRATYTSIEAANPTKGVGFFSYSHVLDNNIFEIWRLGNIHDDPKAPS